MFEIDALFSALSTGQADPILAEMGPDPVVDDQRLGRLSGAQEVTRWVHDSAAWLKGMSADAKRVAVIASPKRTILELSIDIDTEDGRVDLPYVLVAEGQDSIDEIRSYHSTWPYTKGHVFRAPPVIDRTPEPIPAIFEKYVECLRVTDLDWVLSHFTEDGYLREPSGNRWRHAGPEARAAFYGHLEHAPKPRFVLSTSTETDNLIAVEYAFSYGSSPLVGGICIVELAGDRIAAVRITDDVGA